MKKYLAMLLVFALLAGGIFCFAEDLEPEELEIVIADGETEAGDEQDAAAEAEGLLLDTASGQEGEGARGDDGETILAFEVDEEQGSAALDVENTEAERSLASNGSTDVRVGDFTYNFDDGGGKIVKYNGNAKSLNIESTVDYNGMTYKVVRIGESAFEGNTLLESVTLPDSIISIDSSAFSGCTHLTRLTINSDLADCTDNVYRSSYRPFYNTGTYADSLTVIFGSNVTKIPAHIFNTGSSKSDATYAHVTKVIINDGVTAIGDCAFRNCYDLTSIEWGKGLLNIGNEAFASDTGLTEIGLPSKTYSLGENAFSGCTFLKTVTLPASLNSIDSSAFSNCTHLSKLTINSDLADCTDNVYRSSYRPFYNTGTYADSFTVTFGGGVTKIPAHLFNTGSSKSDATYAHVTKVIINDGVTAIGDCAFRNCYDLTSIEWGKGLLDIGNEAFASDTGLTEIELPSKTYSLGENAFSRCTSLNNVTLPASLNSIGSYAFGDCTHLTKLTINSDLADCTDNVYRAGYRPFYNTGTYADSLTVTFCGGVTKIPAHLFNTGCSKESGEYCHVSTVNLPASVKNIGTGAFYCCHDLTNVKFGGSQIDWNQISIGEDNNYITGAMVSYGAAGVAVTGVTLNKTTLSLSKGATATLTATIEPTDATDKGIAWASDNEGVATVSDGRVTVVGVGRATISATSTSNPKKSASCEVTVTESTIAVTGVTISRSTLSLNVGGTATLSASVQPSGAPQGVVWSSSATAVATVSASGVVKAVAAGKATITATSVSDSSRKATCVVTVTSGAILATSIALDREKLTLRIGETATLTRTILPKNTTTKNESYQVSDKSVFVVESTSISGNTCVYTLRGVGAGTAKLTVKTKDGTNLSATCAVTVQPGIPEKDLARVGSNGTVKLNKGEQIRLVASFATKKGWKIKGVSSNNKKVAAVDSTGLVTAKKAGTATVTVKTRNNKKATVKIKVVDPSVPTKIVLNRSGTVKLKKGETLQLLATVSPDTATTTLIWSSSNKKLATVTPEGLVKAKKKGTVTITVKTKNGKKAKVKIKIV